MGKKGGKNEGGEEGIGGNVRGREEEKGSG